MTSSGCERQTWLAVAICPKRQLIYLNNIHSPVQMNPSPLYPGRQAQVKLPTLLVQVASSLQPPLFVAHSFTSDNAVTTLWYTWILRVIIPTVWNFLLKSKLWNKLLIQWQLDIVPQHTKTSFSDTAQWFLIICRFHTVTNWNRRTVHLSRTCSGKIFRYTIKKEHAFKKQYPWFINTICLEGT